MPRGERTREPQVQAKRARTCSIQRQRRAATLAERVLRREIAAADDIEACRGWLTARGVRLEDPDMTPAQRLVWVKRARRAMVP